MHIYGQSYIIGRVRDATTYAPIRDATIFYYAGEWGQTALGVTGDFGEFSGHYDMGEYVEIGIQREGYVDRIVPLVFPKLATTKIMLGYMWVGTSGTHITH